MTRKLQTLGLSLVAALTLSGIVASAAMGGIFFTVGTAPVAISATGTNLQEWTIGGLTVTCNKFTASATQTTLSSHDELLESIKYSECTEKAASRPATVTVNCKFLLETEFTISETRAQGNTTVTKCSGSGYEININSGECVMRLSEEKFKSTEFIATIFGDMTFATSSKALGATYKGKICGGGTEMIELKGVLAASATLTAFNTTLKLTNVP